MSGCRHGLKSCLLCEIEATQPPRQYSAWDAVNVLQARVADQDAELLQLRTRVVELEHRTNDRQAAQAALAEIVANLERRLEEIARLAARANLRVVAK